MSQDSWQSKMTWRTLVPSLTLPLSLSLSFLLSSFSYLLLLLFNILSGAKYSSDRCVVDGKLVTAQTPEDLPAFMHAIVKLQH